MVAHMVTTIPPVRQFGPRVTQIELGGWSGAERVAVVSSDRW